MQLFINGTTLQSPNDLLGALLFGTARRVGVRDFDNLSVLLPLDTPKADCILKLEKIRCCAMQQCRAHESWTKLEVDRNGA